MRRQSVAMPLQLLQTALIVCALLASDGTIHGQQSELQAPTAETAAPPDTDPVAAPADEPVAASPVAPAAPPAPITAAQQCAQLHTLAQQLNEEMVKTKSFMLSVTVLRKASAIEALAHTMSSGQPAAFQSGNGKKGRR